MWDFDLAASSLRLELQIWDFLVTVTQKNGVAATMVIRETGTHSETLRA